MKHVIEWVLLLLGFGAVCLYLYMFLPRHWFKSHRFDYQRLRAAAEELMEVAELRGDSTLPHPADDPKQWTARMQTAWDELADCLAGGVKP